ncbi:MAG: hypothetical protein ABIH38_02835 [Patescibacteria group bacterium]
MNEGKEFKLISPEEKNRIEGVTPEFEEARMGKRAIDAFVEDKSASTYERRFESAVAMKVKLDSKVNEFLSARNTLREINDIKEAIQNAREKLTACGVLWDEIRAVAGVEHSKRLMEVQDSYTSCLMRYNELLESTMEERYDLSHFWHLQNETEEILNKMREFQQQI